ncbi:alkene reductase [Pseudochelatococcus sp. B33]
MTRTTPSIFDPVRLGDLELPNRVIMAPMTRNRAIGAERAPNVLMREYYSQRSGAGLIISEATSVSPSGVGYPHTPGIWSIEQTAGWKSVVEGVHAAGGKILLQLWHVGRLSDPIYYDGAPPIAPSAIAMDGTVSLLRPTRPYPIPRALEAKEIPAIVGSFRSAAANAKAAGFDGVEIHGANGYLLDQFLQDSSNKREDAYGGPIENRARLLLEVTDAVTAVWGPGRVGMHLAPRGDAQINGDSDPEQLFGYVAAQLGRRKLAFICTREAPTGARFSPGLKRAFGGAYVANEGLTFETASALVASGDADAVAFGKPFISNPDLVARFRAGERLAPWKEDTFYGEGAAGYTDYPTAAKNAEERL